MEDPELCKWLRDNSSGTYRPSAEAASRIEELREALALCRHQASYSVGDSNALSIQLSKIRKTVSEALKN